MEGEEDGRLDGAMLADGAILSIFDGLKEGCREGWALFTSHSQRLSTPTVFSLLQSVLLIYPSEPMLSNSPQLINPIVDVDKT